ncbi:patatin-like phospholipase family protein [Maritalea mediterranea]|uniref:Patatin-like phospholipase family protein n=1 Tax=Maritalea mediterranea TaxID=2909667 RepID=A0ABS9E6D4_9HYPH|nr:patatin-like phospholipase family protein [Maritalea mediterranea]MCF4097777.1 patatin-like phospholipase family protein [Maritalea mediterranea]
MAITGPRIGVALGGGAARGLSHIAVIEAMDELGLKPSLIAGTSIGAFIGAGWAAGMSGREIRSYAIDVLGTMRALSSRLWRTQVTGIKAMFQDGISMQFDATKVLTSFAPDTLPIHFEELKIPLRVIATDYRSWHQVVFHTGEIAPAIAGSIAIPSLFKPVEHGGQTLVDGGVVNPLPLEHAAHNMDILIGVDVNGDPVPVNDSTMPSAIDVGLGAAQIMMHSLSAYAIAAYPPDIYVRPPVGHFGAYEFWRVRDILAAGDTVKEKLKRDLATRIDLMLASQQKIG